MSIHNVRMSRKNHPMPILHVPLTDVSGLRGTKHRSVTKIDPEPDKKTKKARGAPAYA